MEQSRYDALVQVLAQLKVSGIQDAIAPHLTVFDNGSVYKQTQELLASTFDNTSSRVYRASENMGYWSAIKWYLDNVDLQNYKFIHIIESDHFYYGSSNDLARVESFMLNNQEVGAVRLQEYDVQHRHLYNKTLQRADGRRYAWVSHVNHVTGDKVRIEQSITDPAIFKTNFLAVLHCMTRVKPFKAVFDDLAKMDRFSENDYQRLFYEHYPTIGLLDGGIFHAKLGFTLGNSKIVSGSWSNNLRSIGYVKTRSDSIRSYKEVI